MTQKKQRPDDTIPVNEAVNSPSAIGVMQRIAPWIIPPIIVPAAIIVALAIMLTFGVKL
jgi:hypothetical protein